MLDHSTIEFSLCELFFVMIIRQFDYSFQIHLITAIFLSTMSKNILLLDNYDSFTENLRHLLIKVRPAYSFTVVRNKDRSIFESHWDGLIISPGPKGPADTDLLKEFFETVVIREKMPLLGVCLGMQFIAWYYGLQIRPSDDARHGRTVTIETTGDDLFKGLERSFKVVRYNSLAIEESIRILEEKTPLKVTAVQNDSKMIMALRHKELPFSAVQFHPESFLTENAEAMMNNFFMDYIDD